MSTDARFQARFHKDAPQASLATSSSALVPFELLEGKLQPPPVGDRSVLRTGLIQRLERSSGLPIVIIRAGPGYGKTTTLVQWADSPKQRPFAWISVDHEDNDPVVLLTYVAVALDRVSPLPPGVFDALASTGASVEAKMLPRLAYAMARMAAPFVLAIDDAHAIENPQCIDAIVALARHLPEGSQLAFSTRDQSALPVGLLRTRALMLELGPDDLRMPEDEARALLEAESLDASDDEIAELVLRTEGWPAGLYLATLSARAAGSAPDQLAQLTGKDPFVVDFLRSEFLARLPPEELGFLMRTSMLERLSGPLCDAVLESSDSAAVLESLERSNRFVVALDRDREWYRCHHLVRETLAAELARSDPDRVESLLRRAFDWCAANGQDVAAIRYGQAAGDVGRVASIMERAVQPVYQSGRTTTVEQWFDWLETHSELEQHPAVAVIGAMFHAASGQPTASDRWAAAAERGSYEGPLPDGSASIESWRAMVRALRCREGIEAMRTDAELAVQAVASDSAWHPLVVVLLGLSELLLGATEKADDLFADATEEARLLAAPSMIPVALAERALVSLGRGEYVRADTFAEHAVWAARRSRLEDSAINALVYAVAARAARRCGRTSTAHELLTRAQLLLPQLTYALPIPAVQTRLEMARTYLELADQGGARTMLREIDAVRRRCPDLGSLSDEATELRSQLSTAGQNANGVSALTAAELRVLPMLTTHLTFRQVGARLYLSPHTVKSHAMSIYRKLDVTSRSAAVQRARDVGLL